MAIKQITKTTVQKHFLRKKERLKVHIARHIAYLDQ